MNYRSTYILFGLVALVLILLAVALIRTPGTEPSKYVLPVLQDKASPVTPNDITRIQIERGSEKIDLTRQGTAWKVNEFRASDMAVNQLLSELFEAQREKADKPDNLSAWGLAPPTGDVKLYRGDNLVAELQLGKTGPANSLYVLDPTRPDDAMSVRKTSLEAVLLPINGFRERTLLGSPGAFSRIELSETEPKKAGEKAAEPGSERKLVLEESSGSWHILKPFKGLAASDGTERRSANGAPSNVPSLEHDLADLQPGPPETSPADFVANNVKPEDFAKYNLDPAKNKVLSVKVTRQGEPKQVDLLIGLDKPADDKGEFYYARLTNEPNIVRVPGKQVKALTALLQEPEVLRDYHLVRLGPQQSVEALKIELRDQEKPVVLEFFQNMPPASPHAELARAGMWQFYIGDQLQGVDQRRLEGLINLLTQDNIITSYPKDDKGSDLDKPKVVVTVYYGGATTIAKPGQKPTINAGAKSIILRFAALGNQDSWASREQDGPPTIVKVKNVLRERVGDGPLAYRSKDLIPYKNPDDPKAFESKLLIQRGGKVETVARGKADEPWKFVAPPPAAGYPVNKSAVQSVLQYLTFLKAENLEREKPDAKTLQEWGFTDPQITKVTVTVTGSDGKTSDHTYEFAKDKDPASVYARQSDRPDLIFSVAKNPLDVVLKAELRDPTIFSFKPDKVNRLNLAVGDVRHTQIHLEKKDGTWIDKDNPKLKLDSDKLHHLQVQMGTLQAQSFVPGAVDPAKSGLKPEDGALVITAFVEGEGKPYILTVGKPDGMETYATSNRLPEDDKQPREVFKVRKYLFDNDEGKPSLKTDPGYLYTK